MSRGRANHRAPAAPVDCRQGCHAAPTLRRAAMCIPYQGVTADSLLLATETHVAGGQNPDLIRAWSQARGLRDV